LADRGRFIAAINKLAMILKDPADKKNTKFEV
jgi:hypothetical protein